MLQEHALHFLILTLLGLTNLCLLIRKQGGLGFLRWQSLASAFLTLIFLFSVSACHTSANPFLNNHSSSYHPCCAPQVPTASPIVLLKPSSQVVERLGILLIQPVQLLPITSPTGRGPPTTAV